MARRAHPPSELRSGVQAGLTRKHQLAAPTSTLPDGLFFRGAVWSGLGVFHLSEPSVLSSSGKDRRR
jgi:hypothetical protein